MRPLRGRARKGGRRSTELPAPEAKNDPMTEGRRGKRVAEDIRSHLSSALVVECADPRLAQLVITRVALSADLGVADVSVRSLATAPSEADRLATMRALASAAGRLRRVLGERLRMKRTPALRFHYDEDPDNRGRVDALLEEIRTEEQARSKALGDANASEPGSEET